MNIISSVILITRLQVEYGMEATQYMAEQVNNTYKSFRPTYDMYRLLISICFTD